MTRTEQRRPETGIRYSALAAGLAITPFALGSDVAAALGGRAPVRPPAGRTRAAHRRGPLWGSP